jgi:hypothetical protein
MLGLSSPEINGHHDTDKARADKALAESESQILIAAELIKKQRQQKIKQQQKQHKAYVSHAPKRRGSAIKVGAGDGVVSHLHLTGGGSSNR